MQSATSDVNAAVMSMRNQLVFARSSGDSEQVRHAIYTLNEILPEDFQLIFDTEYYENSIMPLYSIICKCGGECKVSQITTKYENPSKVFGRWSHEFAQPALRKYVICTDCKNKVFIKNSELILEKKSKFATAKYVPEEPVFFTLYNRALNHGAYWNWVMICHAALERQLRIFRQSFSNQDGKLL